MSSVTSEDLQATLRQQAETIRDLQRMNELLIAEVALLRGGRGPLASCHSKSTSSLSRPVSSQSRHRLGMSAQPKDPGLGCELQSAQSQSGLTSPHATSENPHAAEPHTDHSMRSIFEDSPPLSAPTPLQARLATLGITPSNQESKLEHALSTGDLDTAFLIIETRDLPSAVLQSCLQRFVRVDDDHAVFEILAAGGLKMRSTAVAVCAANAVACGQAVLLQAILAAGANPNSDEGMGTPCLCIAAASGDLDCVDVLINNNVDVHAKNSTGDTALAIAAAQGHTEVVRRLMDQEADINVCEGHGRISGFMYAASGGTFDVSRVVMKGGGAAMGWSPLMYAAEAGHLATVKLLVDAGAELQRRGFAGVTVLMCAAFGGHVGVVQFLLVVGCKVDVQDWNGMTALMYAAREGTLQVVRLLLDANCDVSHRCARGGHHRHKILTTKTATPEADGWTALMYAAERGHLDVVRLLVLSGADTRIKDVNGDNGLTLAKARGHGDVVSYLKDRMSAGCCVIA